MEEEKKETKAGEVRKEGRQEVRNKGGKQEATRGYL